MKELFENFRITVDEWIDASFQVRKNALDATKDKRPTYGLLIDERIEAGIRFERELQSYAGVEFDGPQELSRSLIRENENLARTRRWIYNKQVIELIKYVETESQLEKPPLENIELISKIKEDQLDPYVAQRLFELWERLFEELDEDGKVKATKLRLLKSSLDN